MIGSASFLSNIRITSEVLSNINLGMLIVFDTSADHSRSVAKTMMRILIIITIRINTSLRCLSEPSCWYMC